MRQNLDKEHLLSLTLAVYRVIAIFPAEESEANLGFQIRELADKILVNLLSGGENDSRYIGDLLGLFNLAEEKHWVDSRNFLVLKREYEKVRQILAGSKISGKTVENPLFTANGNGQNNHRQEKILEVMNGNGMVKIGELIKMFPGINRRTVLRDLGKLCQVGAVVRNGNGRGAHYLKNGHNHDMS